MASAIVLPNAPAIGVEAVSTERRRSIFERAAALVPLPQQGDGPGGVFACVSCSCVSPRKQLRKAADEPLPVPPPQLTSKESFACPVKHYFRAIRSWDKVENLERTYDVFLSFESASCSDLFDRLRQELSEYQMAFTTEPADLDAVRESRHVVVLMTPQYFEQPTCCAELCAAVKAGIECLLVTVEGATWGGKPFPSLDDIPETVRTPQSMVRPRDAAKAVFQHKLALEYRTNYSTCFVEKMRERLGPPKETQRQQSARLRAPGAGWLSRGESIELAHEGGRDESPASPRRRDIKYDAFLSHRQKESQDTVGRVHDKLTAAGYRTFLDRNDLVELTGMKLAVRHTSTFVAFLSATYFQSAACCLEVCEAAALEVPVILVLVEGSSWGGKPFPALEDVPESIEVQDEERVMTLRPRDAMRHIFASSPRLDHTRNYFAAFVDVLFDALGPPPAVESLQGEARAIWQAAGGGTAVAWSALRAQLLAAKIPGYEGAEPVLVQALGAADGQVTATTFASLFPADASLKAIIEALGGGAAVEERVLRVEVIGAEQEEGGGGSGFQDGGLALVGPTTSLQEVRAQLIEAHLDEEEEAEAGLEELSQQEQALSALIATGRFAFLIEKQRRVRRKQEKLVKGKQIGEPVTIKVEKSSHSAGAGAELSLRSEASTESAAYRVDLELPGELSGDPTTDSKAAVVAAVKGVKAAAARTEANSLDLDAALRDGAKAASLRRHASSLKGATSDPEASAVLAQRLLALNDALAAGDAGRASQAAEALRGFVAADARLTAKVGGAASTPAALAEALQEEDGKARAAVRPALERMRTEILHSAGTGGVGLLRAGLVGGIKGEQAGARRGPAVTRVVVLGGGPCGVTAAHQLSQLHEGFHVTLVDTKEYYEDTPSVLRMMTANDCEGAWHHHAIPYTDILRGKGEIIVGAATAVRRDHVLVGTTAGVASRVLPFDYLILSTGTSYFSDIKTEGASVQHRKQSFEMERQRMAEVDSFTVVGAGLVGVELATDLKSYFPDKNVHVITRSDGWLPRIPGAHPMVDEVCKEMGVTLHTRKEIVHTDEEGRAVAADGERLGDKNSRTYWATGYRPNTSYLTDSRTDRAIREVLDPAGFVRVTGTQQLQVEGVEHIFAGGDVTWAAAHSHGERTAFSAWLHAGIIVQNILLLASKREGALKTVKLNQHAGLETIAISLGTNAGLMYATDPNFEVIGPSWLLEPPPCPDISSISSATSLPCADVLPRQGWAARKARRDQGRGCWRVEGGDARKIRPDDVHQL